ncbi:MAG: glycosyltransferase family 2 protein [Litoreibacter sp.]|nr:glycosyltransferase family 2 protein [Litoreibacter sp.]
MRWKRRRLLWRAFRSRHQLTVLQDKTGSIGARSILLFCVVRNEKVRLPHFLKYYRALGVDAFFFVDNGSDDGTLELLLKQDDCSVWQTQASYKAARFGMDWINHLLRVYGSGRYCLTVDADELIDFSGMNRVDLKGLRAWMEARDRASLGGLMIELFPKGLLGASEFEPGSDPLRRLTFFDARSYRAKRQTPLRNLWVQGGARERVFFKTDPRRSPTLNKIPLVKWQRGYAYVNSTHSMLPPKMNEAYIDGLGEMQPSVALLHTKFLPDVVARSAEEKKRGEHFSNSRAFDAYYNALCADLELWHEDARLYEGPEQLEALGLIKAGDWER